MSAASPHKTVSLRYHSILAIVRTAPIIALLVAIPAQAQMEQRASFLGTVGDQRHAIMCPGRSFLVGLAERQTDRLIGVLFDCVPATKQQRWNPDQLVQQLGPGNLRDGTMNKKACPPDYFMVGLKATFGTYESDKVTPQEPTEKWRLIADLAPVCRNFQDVYFELTRSKLDQAENNELSDVNWDGIGGSRSCRAGYAVVRISFRYEDQGHHDDLTPANRFRDAALTCRRLPFDKTNAVSTVPR